MYHINLSMYVLKIVHAIIGYDSIAKCTEVCTVAIMLCNALTVCVQSCRFGTDVVDDVLHLPTEVHSLLS
jgi:hypothetical protein